jgi:DNA-binding SARP family transcriptional activator
MSSADIDITVLGPVSVRGAAAPFRRTASLELVVFLAFHRRGVRHAECALALWPNHDVSPSTMHSTASDARRSLGRAVDGSPVLPRGARLRLHPSVTTDVDRFASWAATGEPRQLRRALRLVRGPLFGGLQHADWAVLDGTAASIENMVVSAGLRGAEDLMARGDGEGAEWIVRQTLLMSPYDERLYRALLRATAAQGDRSRLRSTMAQLQVLAGAGSGAGRLVDGAEGALHPQTTGLYRDLLRVSPATGRHPARL